MQGQHIRVYQSLSPITNKSLCWCSDLRQLCLQMAGMPAITSQWHLNGLLFAKNHNIHWTSMVDHTEILRADVSPFWVQRDLISPPSPPKMAFVGFLLFLFFCFVLVRWLVGLGFFGCGFWFFIFFSCPQWAVVNENTVVQLNAPFCCLSAFSFRNHFLFWTWTGV